LGQDKEWVIEEPDPGAPSGLEEDKSLSGAQQADAGEHGKESSESSRESREEGPAPEAPGAPQREPQANEKSLESAERIPEQERGREGDIAEPVQKRMKRASRKELLELIRRKNAMLIQFDKEVKKTKQDLAIKDDRLLRLAAEFENYKKRTRREWELLQKRANADLIKEIIGGIDNFDRAFANLGGVDSQLHDGIKLIHAGFLDVLKRAGLKEIEALNQKFDPLYHEAVGEIDSEGMAEGHVAQVVQKGYTLNDQVLRPARVMVSKKKG
jgi:molecular chaperone GrpE